MGTTQGRNMGSRQQSFAVGSDPCERSAVLQLPLRVCAFLGQGPEMGYYNSAISWQVAVVMTPPFQSKPGGRKSYF